MTIPKIQSYPLDAFSEENLKRSVTNKVEVNGIQWPIDSNRSVLLVHDMQNYFTGFYGEDSALLSVLIENIERVKKSCKKLGIPVVYTAQPANQTPQHRALLTDFWGPGLQSGPKNNESIVESLAPTEDDICYTKWRYSAFQRTPLLQWMREQQRDQLVIVGIYAHIGILSTALEAFMSDIKPYVISDAIADFSHADHLMALNYIANRCGVVKTTRALLGDLDDSALSFEQIKKAVADSINVPVDELNDDDNLLDLGLDSVTLMEMVENWNRKGADLRFAEIAEFATVREWWSLIRASIHKSTTERQLEQVNG